MPLSSLLTMLGKCRQHTRRDCSGNKIDVIGVATCSKRQSTGCDQVCVRTGVIVRVIDGDVEALVRGEGEDVRNHEGTVGFVSSWDCLCDLLAYARISW